MVLRKFSLDKVFRALAKAWSPKDVETVEGVVIRAAKFDGEYHWHKHDKEDELFIVFKGKIKIQTREEDIVLGEGEGVKIPKGIEHCPISIEPSFVLMLEPLELQSAGSN